MIVLTIPQAMSVENIHLARELIKLVDLVDAEDGGLIHVSIVGRRCIGEPFEEHRVHLSIDAFLGWLEEQELQAYANPLACLLDWRTDIHVHGVKRLIKLRSAYLAFKGKRLPNHQHANERYEHFTVWESRYSFDHRSFFIKLQCARAWRYM